MQQVVHIKIAYILVKILKNVLLNKPALEQAQPNWKSCKYIWN